MLDRLDPPPRVLALHAHDFEGMFRDLRELGKAVGRDADPLERRLRGRIERVRRRARGLPRRRVFCMEWFDPPYTSGHWVPEMVEMAGGRDGLARRKKNSRRVEWPEIETFAPETLILMPCGFTMKRAERELDVLRARPEWDRLPAVRAGEVYLVDGPSYFNGAGPRLVRGLEILAEILHPQVFPRRTRRGWRRVRP
ncbi:MAG: ABC transporter substrate-binding protein [Planctomycetota bacterium]